MTDNSTMDDLSPDALIRLPYGVVANEPAITLNGSIEYDRVLNVHKLGTDGEWCVYRETVFDTDDFEAQHARRQGFEHPISEKYGIARTKSVDIDKRIGAFEKPLRPQLIDDLRSEFDGLPFTYCVAYADKLDAVTTMNAFTSPRSAIIREAKNKYTDETDIDLSTAKPAYVTGSRYNFIVIGIDDVPIITPYRFEIGIDCYTWQIKDKVLRQHIDDDVSSINEQMFAATEKYAKDRGNLRRCGYSTSTRNKMVYRLFPESPDRQLEMFRNIQHKQGSQAGFKIGDNDSASALGLDGIIDVIKPYHEMLCECNELAASGNLDCDIIPSIDECIKIRPDRRCGRAFDDMRIF